MGLNKWNIIIQENPIKPTKKDYFVIMQNFIILKIFNSLLKHVLIYLFLI